MHPLSSRQDRMLHLDTSRTDVEDALHSSKSYDSGVDLTATHSPSCRARPRLHPYLTPPSTAGLPFGARMEHETIYGVSPEQWPDFIQITQPARRSRDLSDTSSIDSSSTGSSGASKIHEPTPRKRSSFNTSKIRRPISYHDESGSDIITDSESDSEHPAPFKSLSPFHQQFAKNEGLSPTKIWNVILPWLLDNFDQIIGERNTGAIDFIQQDRDMPTICITAANTSSVDRRPIDRKLAEITKMRFQVEIRRGATARTARRVTTRWPAANLGYAKTPLCGSSIGVQGSGDLASFGGFLQIQFDENGGAWELFGLTSHHVLEERSRDTPVGNGVVDGKLNGRDFRIQQPARQHIEDDVYHLDRHLQVVDAMLHRMTPRDARKQQLERQKSTLRASRKKIKAVLSNLDLGRVKHSSGYGTMRDRHQMDWALISDIPAHRSEFGNILPGGSVSSLLYEPGAPITEIADPSFFEAAMELTDGELARRDQTPPEPLCRIHGCGAITGNQTGYLSGTQSVVRLGRYDSPSLEWSFAPYNSLGTQGDSGSWIFNDFGACIGMIIGRNEEENLTYFTPMHCILEDIKARTRAKDVRLARFDLPRYLFTAGLRDSGIDVSSGRSSTVNSAGEESHDDIYVRHSLARDHRPEFRTMRTDQDQIPPRVLAIVGVRVNNCEQLQADYRKAAEDAAAKCLSKPLPATPKPLPATPKPLPATPKPLMPPDGASIIDYTREMMDMI